MDHSVSGGPYYNATFNQAAATKVTLEAWNLTGLKIA